MTRDPEIVWLTEARTYAVLVKMGAWYSIVRCTRENVTFELMISNDEFETWEEHAIDYDTDED